MTSAVVLNKLQCSLPVSRLYSNFMFPSHLTERVLASSAGRPAPPRLVPAPPAVSPPTETPLARVADNAWEIEVRTAK